MTTAAERWRTELAGWAIPEPILAAAPEPPWGFPVELFGAEPDGGDSVSRATAAAVLPAGGSVLDVGCGGGTAGLALAPPAGRVVGVDDGAGMLDAFRAAANARGVDHLAVDGTWPAVAASVDPVDVVVCHHVLYNVPDLQPFVDALTQHARRRVVVELTEAHPMVASASLWRHFHDLPRPDGPTAALAAEVIRDLGIDVRVEPSTQPARPVPREVYVRLNRRRLCLPVSAEPEVDRVMGPVDGPRRIVTLSWDAG